MSRILRLASGLLFGAMIGAGLVLLFAPRSGSETRQQIRDCFQEILAEGRKAAEDRRLELTTEFQALKQPRSGVA